MIQENVEAEIMQVLLEEARDSYEENIILVRRKWHLFSFPRSQD
jgi:broad-specificity NMP kinase